MSTIDQFESVFKAAIKEVFVFKTPVFRNVLIVTDLKKAEASVFAGKIQKLLASLGGGLKLKYEIVTGDKFGSTEELLKMVTKKKPDLICTYRNLHSNAWKFPHSLGEYLDVLLQKVYYPVLVVPHPEAGYADKHAFDGMNNVMAITDHLSSEHRLVNYAAKFTQTDGALCLAHIEDEAYYERVIDAISKIPEIDTAQAEVLIKDKLLSDASDYIKSCTDILKEHYDIKIKNIVKFGHHLKHYRAEIEKKKINLLVMNTRDDDQMAMHGLAYPLAVELRQISLLML
jgi:hypothetical protein